MRVVINYWDLAVDYGRLALYWIAEGDARRAFEFAREAAAFGALAREGA